MAVVPKLLQEITPRNSGGRDGVGLVASGRTFFRGKSVSFAGRTGSKSVCPAFRYKGTSLCHWGYFQTRIHGEVGLIAKNPPAGATIIRTLRTAPRSRESGKPGSRLQAARCRALPDSPGVIARSFRRPDPPSTRRAAPFAPGEDRPRDEDLSERRAEQRSPGGRASISRRSRGPAKDPCHAFPHNPRTAKHRGRGRRG